MPLAPFAAERRDSEMFWYYIEFYKINRTLHGRLEIRNFLSPVELTRREISYLQMAM